MQKHYPKSSQLKRLKTNSQKGVVLIEALIAILIFSMGILALVGLQAAMIKNTTENKYRADASFIAQEQLGRVWTEANHAILADFVGQAPPDITDRLPNGAVTLSVAARGLVTARVTWQSPGGEQHNYEASTYIDSRFE